MRKKSNFRKKKPREKQLNGLQVKVYNNNIEGALKQFKKKVKNSNLMLELSKKSYYEKPSKLRRERKNLAILRDKYKNQKQEKDF
jgi:ribosomal protein S21